MKKKTNKIVHRYKRTPYLERLHGRIRKARKLRAEGLTYAEVADALETTSTTIIRWVKHSPHVKDKEER